MILILIMILILRNSELQNGELKHAEYYSENSDSGIAD
jgi:hypothetical protein